MRKQVIDLRDARVDHRLGVFRDRHRAFQNLGDELLDQVLAALPAPPGPRQTAFLDNLIEQTCLDYLFGGSARAAAAFCASAIGILLRPSLRFSLSSLSLSLTAFAQQLFQLVVALQAAAQVRKPVAQIQQLAQRIHLARHRSRARNRPCS